MLTIFFDHLRFDPETAAAAREVGLQAADCSIDDLRHRSVGEIDRFLRDAGLACRCVFGTADISSAEAGSFRAGMDTARFMMDAAGELGADHLMLVPGFAADVADKPRAAARMAEGMNILAEEARPRGISLSIENFSQVLTPYARVDEIWDMLKAVPELGFTLDTGNFRCRDIDVLEAMEALMPRTVRLHLKDWGSEPRGTGAFTAADGAPLYGAPLGEGFLPLDEVCRRLTTAGFAGDCCVEMNCMTVTRDDVVRSVVYAREHMHL